MPQLVIPDIEETILERLRELATQHAQTAEAEARRILLEALQPPLPNPWTRINALREALAQTGQGFPDSTPLIREDRER